VPYILTVIISSPPGVTDFTFSDLLEDKEEKMVQTTIPARSEIAPEHTWNAPSVFASNEAWEQEFKQIEDSLPALQKFQSHLADGSPVLADALDGIYGLYRRLGMVFVYASMFHSVDTADQTASAMDSQARSLYGRFIATTSYLNPELIAIGHDTLKQWLAQEARLKPYDHYFDNLFRQQAHVRSAEVEEILGMVVDPFSSVSGTASVLTNAEIHFRPATSSTGESLPVMQGSINTLLGSPDRETRRTAWENYADGYLSFKNTLSSNLSVVVKQDVFFARARNYESALDAALFPNNIPVAVFNNLINTFRKHLPTWHRYWAIRRKALGYEKLYPYDVWAPLTQNDPEVPFAQAVDWISEGMKPLGEEYVSILRQGALKDRWVDIYPNQGKRQGAFSSGTPGTHPFIMMSYGKRVASMSTLAHELGHSMHSYLTWREQPMVYTDYSLFVAEVASNFNQAMVRAHLLNNNADPDFQIAVIEEAMSNFHRYFFIMPTLARFELEVHERTERGKSLTADAMISLMTDLFAEGYGGEVEPDGDRTGITWAQFNHMYANFYVFQYATGISGAHALAQRVLDGEPNAADNYLAFLKAGGSLYPLDALKRAGVDLTTPEPVEKTFGVLSSMVDRLEQLVSQR
jgi:oligoendopeptidase F